MKLTTNHVRILLPLAAGLALVATACGGATEARSSTAASSPPRSELEQIVHDRVDSGASTGIVAGMLFADGTSQIVAYGKSGNSTPLDVDSVFEIGSITKTLTGTLLAEMVGRGEVHLSEPVADLLPASVIVPSLDGHRITLEDLATHTSGLPRSPDNLNSADPANPYAEYSVQQMYDFLGTYSLPRDPGSKVEYSNLGLGLLGHALALEAGQSYEQLLTSRVLEPLGMPNTSIALADDEMAHFVTGHDSTGAVAPNFDMPTLAGAGALRSNITDMLTYAQANLDASSGPLDEAMTLARSARKGEPGSQVGLGWEIGSPGEHEIVWHNGGTAGFSSFIGLDEAAHTAIVVLSNTRWKAIDDIGFHLLDSTVPLAAGPHAHTEIDLTPEVLDNYIGTYDIEGGSVTVTRSGTQLTLTIPGQPAEQIYPESTTSFFFKDANAHIEFVLDTYGYVIGATYYDDLGNMIGAHRQPEHPVAGEVLDRYVGSYEINGETATIVRTTEGLSATLGDQTVPMFAESDTTFFFRDIDGVVTFDVDANGNVTGGTLYQGGQAIAARKIG